MTPKVSFSPPSHQALQVHSELLLHAHLPPQSPIPAENQKPKSKKQSTSPMLSLQATAKQEVRPTSQ